MIGRKDRMDVRFVVETRGREMSGRSEESKGREHMKWRCEMEVEEEREDPNAT